MSILLWTQCTHFLIAASIRIRNICQHEPGIWDVWNTSETALKAQTWVQPSVPNKAVDGQ